MHILRLMQYQEEEGEEEVEEEEGILEELSIA